MNQPTACLFSQIQTPHQRDFNLFFFFCWFIVSFNTDEEEEEEMKKSILVNATVCKVQT